MEVPSGDARCTHTWPRLLRREVLLGAPGRFTSPDALLESGRPENPLSRRSRYSRSPRWPSLPPRWTPRPVTRPYDSACRPADRRNRHPLRLCGRDPEYAPLRDDFRPGGHPTLRVPLSLSSSSLAQQPPPTSSSDFAQAAYAYPPHPTKPGESPSTAHSNPPE